MFVLEDFRKLHNIAIQDVILRKVISKQLRNKIFKNNSFMSRLSYQLLDKIKV
jgi:hypothetical protein